MNAVDNSNNIGVCNPFALTEAILKRKVNWQKITEPKKLIEETLKIPYEKLFDPKYDSPLYPNLKINLQNKIFEKNDKYHPIYIIPKLSEGNNWVDPGDFFEEGTELTDPIQGAVANCYFIAALTSIAWARPYVIAQRNRATGLNQEQFVDMIEFHSKGKTEKIEVSEKLPVIPPSNALIYARSSEVGEIWPGVYEKAYAKWKTHDTGDTPNILATAYGSAVGALVELTGLPSKSFSNQNMTPSEIWQKIRSNCISHKTFNPMVAWTYGTAPTDDVDYSSAHIVANHAYSLLGWDYTNDQMYVILRNPWGTYESTLNIEGSTWVAWDQPYYGSSGWWRPIDLPKNDGIFALRADTFKKYFAGFGLVETPEAP